MHQSIRQAILHSIAKIVKDMSSLQVVLWNVFTLVCHGTQSGDLHFTCSVLGIYIQSDSTLQWSLCCLTCLYASGKDLWGASQWQCLQFPVERGRFRVAVTSCHHRSGGLTWRLYSSPLTPLHTKEPQDSRYAHLAVISSKYRMYLYPARESSSITIFLL